MSSETLGSMLIATEWYQTTSGLISVIVGAIGGGSVVAGLVSKFVTDRALENRKAELSRETERLKGSLNNELERLKGEIARETETHKTQMKRIELIQSKEIDAALAFIGIAKSIHPKPDEPDADYYEACVRIVARLGRIHEELDEFMAKNKLFLSKKSRELLASCSNLAAMHQFDIENPDEEASSEAVSAVEKLLKILEDVEAQMIADVRGQ